MVLGFRMIFGLGGFRVEDLFQSSQPNDLHHNRVQRSDIKL